MTVRVEDVASTLGEIYQSATSDRGWDQPLQHIARLFGGEFATLEIYNKQTFQPLFMAESSEIEVQQSYLEHFMTQNPRFEMLSKLPKALVYSDYDLLDEAQMSGNAFYEDFLGRYGLRYCIAMRVLETPDAFGVFTVQRARESGHVDEAELRLAEVLAPQLASAAQLHMDNLERSQRSAAIESGLDVLGEAVLVISSSGRIASKTKAAAQMLKAADGIDARAGRLVFSDPSAQERFYKALGRMQPNGSLPKVAERFIAHRPSGNRELVVHVVPAGESPITNAMATVVIFDPALVTAVDTTLLQDAFGLTPAETALACALADGMSVTRYANDCGLSRNTVRSHLQKLMHKCAVSRQQELMLMLRAYRK